MTDAFVDRTPIDWAALLARVSDPRERARLEILRRLDRLRGAPVSSVVPPGRGLSAALLKLLVAVAGIQTLAGVIEALKLISVDGPLEATGPRLIVMLTFASAGLLLASASARDRRVLLLLATFTFAASAFAHAIVTLREDGTLASSLLFRGVFPEAFVPAALWQFAVVFPSVQRFTRFDVWSRRIAAAVWGISSWLFVVNVAAAHGVAALATHAFRRNDPGNLFWHLFATAALPAFATILLRAHRAPPAERRKALRLGCGLALSATPLLAVAMARLVLPQSEQWMLTAGGTVRFLVDALVISGLAAMPVLATLAVIVDRPFELDAVLPGSVRRWLAGSGLRVAEIIHTRSLRPLHRREWLTGAIERLRHAGGPRDLRDILSRELQFGAGASTVTVIAAGELPHDSALPMMLEESSAPVLLSRDAEPFVLLPARDRAWIEARDIALAAPLALRDGALAAVVLLGPKRGGASYERTDCWFIATLLTAAAAMWDIRDLALERDATMECAQCGCVLPGSHACACGGSPIAASLPARLAGKFELHRRLGAGGMGVVYLARDMGLGRAVALKTLPRRRGDAVGRLRDEARAMAALNHPALATIYGLEIWRGTPVLVVEYMAGGTLADRLARGTLTRDDAIALGVRLAEALAYMHDRGLLHRDVKPANIGFTADGMPKLLDFGLSDADGNVAGTPGYLPPEALAGSPPDAAIDLWGLAVVLLEAAGAHHDLAPFFQSALAAARRDRFQSAREMRDALERQR